jgi:hypothetical protein
VFDQQSKTCIAGAKRLDLDGVDTKRCAADMSDAAPHARRRRINLVFAWRRVGGDLLAGVELAQESTI